MSSDYESTADRCQQVCEFAAVYYELIILRLVEMVSHRVRQCSYGIIKNEQVLVLILPKCKNQRVQDEAQDAFEQLGHEGFEMGIRRLADHPVGIATQCPAGNGADEGLLVTQTLNKVGDELRQVPVRQGIIIIILVFIDVLPLFSLPSFMLQSDGARLVETRFDILLTVWNRLILFNIALEDKRDGLFSQSQPELTGLQGNILIGVLCALQHVLVKNTRGDDDVKVEEEEEERQAVDADFQQHDESPTHVLPHFTILITSQCKQTLDRASSTSSEMGERVKRLNPAARDVKSKLRLERGMIGGVVIDLVTVRQE
ncbi:hypothetical protein INR49_026467 [Caranx melampygus]|nr:hypothetical protein INR49_026467 [Caranx melampygus]